VGLALFQEPLMTSGMPDMTRAENHLLSMEVNIAENETTSSILLEDLVVRCEFYDSNAPLLKWLVHVMWLV